MKTPLKIVLVSAIALFAVLLFNTFSLKSTASAASSSIEIPRDDSAALHLSEAIQIKTVSFGDTLPIDTAEFIKFRLFMERTYPLMHAKLEEQSFNEFSYVFKWNGKDTSMAPYVSTEQMLENNFTPERTFYFCFGHDEEIAGKRGANIISQWFKEKNINPAFVLDEGGMIDTEKFKDVKRPVAVIATGEKGFVNVDISVAIPGGHSSQPEKETAIDVLNKAIVKVREKQMPPIISPPVKSLLEKTAAEQSFVKKIAIANMWLFKNLVIKGMEENKQTNAMVHTTLVPTIVKAGIKDNVIPSIANATFNSRILPGQTSDDVVNFVKNAINDERVTVKKQNISLMEASSSTPSNHPSFQMLESITQKIVPNVLVSPYLLIGATDSRYFRPFSDAVLNFTPMQNAKGFHGIDERIGVTDLSRMISFYKLVLAEK